MAKQKKVSKATEDEHMALEAAMNELTKQTDELLKQTKPKEEKKPELPKKVAASAPETSKKIVPHTKGASLDIVGHSPSSPRKTASKNSFETSDEELLPATAGLSYNEKPSVKVEEAQKNSASKTTSPSATVTEEKTPMIQSHVGKRIEPTGAAVASKAIKSEDVAKKTTPESEQTGLEESSKSEPETKLPSQKPEERIKVSEDDKEEVIKVGHKVESKAKHPETEDSLDLSSDDELELLEDDKPEAKSPKSASEKTADGDQVDDEDDGIIKMKDEAGEDSEKPKDDKKKVPSYDIAEYQAQLHDWSKLSRNSHWPFLLLILLLAVAGGLMYLYFSGNLPQFFSA